MKTLPTSLFFFLTSCYLLAQIEDTISVQWEEMNLPAYGIFTLYEQYHNTLFAGSENGLYQSSDQGLNWELNPAVDTGIIYSIHSDEDFMLVAKSAPVFGIYRSEDGGNSFDLVLSLPPLSGGQGQGLHIPWISPFYKKDSDNFYLINGRQFVAQNGWSPSRGIVYHSSDAGLTWQPTPIEALYLAFSEDRIWATHLTNLFYSFENDLSNPVEIYVSSQDIAIPNKGFWIIDNTLTMVQSSGAVSRSIDNGENWQIEQLPFTEITDVIKVGNEFYFTDRTGLFRAANPQWTDFEPLYIGALTPKFVSDIAVLEAGIYLNSITGATLRSVDGGQNWMMMNQGLGHSLLTGIYPIKDEIWATGRKGQIHRSNEGLEWQLVKASNFFDVIENNNYYEEAMTPIAPPMKAKATVLFIFLFILEMIWKRGYC